MASEQRRQKRKAIREAKKNLTKTTIEDNLAYVLDKFLTDEHFFKHIKSLCDDLELEYPKDAKTGYEMPIFNKNPLTNDIEIHTSAVELFEAFQTANNLVDFATTLDADSDDYKFIVLFITVIYKDPSFGTYLRSLYNPEKGSDNMQLMINNMEEIKNKLMNILEI